jgi:uncharacterized HAD superfamily protein
MSTNTNRLLIDVDGTVCHNLPRICEHVNAKYDLSTTPEDVTEWSFHFEEIDKRIGEVAAHLLQNRTSWYIDDLSMFDNVKPVLKELNDIGLDLVVATHRPPETHEATERWFQDRDIPYDKFVEQVPENKAELRGDVLIDDHHEQVARAANTGKIGILMDQPYNNPVYHNRAYTVTSWIEVRDILEEREFIPQDGDSS